MKLLRQLIAAGILVFAIQNAGAAALTVTYTMFDLTDSAPEIDRWQVTYHVTGSLNAFEGFNVLFSPTDFVGLTVESVPSGWFTYTIGPDLIFAADGIFSASTDGTGALPADFVVSFDWTGSGTPGSQSYEIFDDSFNVVAASATLPAAIDPGNPLPEPGSLFLIGAGLAAFGMGRRNYQKR